jgi:SRSO17 transposase
MTEAQAVRSRKRLEQFLVDLLEPVGRSERRHWGGVYVRSLLLNGERKSIEPLAQRLPEGNVQAMQQFIGQSPWDWNPVWERLARRMTSELAADSAWVVDDTGFPKQGTHSVGVERQYSGTLGKTGNCQIAVSVHHVGEQGNAPLGWRLYLPESWTKDAERRKEAGIPEDLVFRKKWELALDIIDQIRDWGLPDQVVLADAGYGDGTEFREELEKRGLAYAVGVTPQVGVWLKPPKINVPEAEHRGRPPTAVRYGPQHPMMAQEAARQAKGWKKIRWREGSKGWLESRFWAARVQPSHRYQDGRPPGKPVWLLGRVAGVGAGPHQVLPVRSSRPLHAAAAGAAGQVPVEDRAGLPPTERRTRSGPLRRAQLAGLAPPRHDGHARARLPYAGNPAQQKKLLGGPCRGRDVRFNT